MRAYNWEGAARQNGLDPLWGYSKALKDGDTFLQPPICFEEGYGAQHYGTHLNQLEGLKLALPNYP